MSVFLAVLATLVYGTAVAVQHHEASQADPAHLLRPRLLLGLALRPVWLIGLFGDVGGFALQTAALGLGSLVVVQTILTANLVVSLLLSSRLAGRHLDRRDWAAVGGVLSGLVVFLAVAHPTEHSDATASLREWLLLGAIAAAVVIVMAGAGQLGMARAGGLTRRAVLFALAASVSEGVMAVMAKALGDRIGRGAAGTFASWEPYAVVASGVLTLVLVQSAYHVDRPTVTLPILTVAEPITAITIGLALFGEHVHLSAVGGPTVAAALVVMVSGLVAVARRSGALELAESSSRGGSG